MAANCGLTLNSVRKAHERILPYIYKTPVFTSSQADARSGRRLYFKAENLQKTGSFKARGALNAILKLKDSKTFINGVVTHSSGNHGQALAWASKVASVPCYVVVSAAIPAAKKQAIVAYGAVLIECGPQASDRYSSCDKIQAEKNVLYIPTSDHLDVIAGQGTIVLELLEQVPDLDAILVTVSGGGMASGIALAAKLIKPDIKVFLVTPQGKLLEECLRTGQRPWVEEPKYLNTIADGIRLQQTGYITTPILIDLAEKDVFEMSDEEVIDGMKFSFSNLKLVIEAAAGAAVAAVFCDKLRVMDSSMKKVGVILCGGNLDISNLPW